ncbi:transposase [Nocardia sp. CS682]|uniref:transposase n=1 Tax=Nocardia sp. CS682 TaxID=1047172 RepID=UPI0010757294|nr:hypothetical protein DMB37_00560 [Nocardia sp. CS682]
MGARGDRALRPRFLGGLWLWSDRAGRSHSWQHRRSTPDKLKARAVRLYREPDPKPTIRKLAEQLGVHHEALRNWIRQAEADAGERDDRPSADMLAENRALRNGSRNWSGSTSYCVLRVRISPRS